MNINCNIKIGEKILEISISINFFRGFSTSSFFFQKVWLILNNLQKALKTKNFTFSANIFAVENRV